MNDESGVLIEGFELRPMIRQPWHPPYYQQLHGAAPGMTKAMDLLMWNLEVTDRDKVLPVICELAEKVESEHGIRVRPMRRRQLRKDIDSFAEVYNAAWSRTGTSCRTRRRTSTRYAQELQLVFDKHWFMIAEKDDTGEVVGMAITFPDINQVLAKMNGRLLPLGWWHFLKQGQAAPTACASASSASSPSTSTPASPRSSTSEHFDAAERARRTAARWAGSSRPTRR